MEDVINVLSHYLQTGVQSVEKFRDAVNKGDLTYISLSSEIADETSKSLSDIGRYYMQLDVAAQAKAADYIAETSKILGFYYGFLDELFKAVATAGLEEQGTQWITFLISCFSFWSDKSKKFRCAVLSSGFLLSHIREVTTLGQDSVDKFVTNTIQFNLNTLFNCSQEEMFSLYYERTTWIDFFVPWISCSEIEIKWYCKFILCNLQPILEENELSLLRINEDEADLLLKALQMACIPSIRNVRILTIGISALELVTVLDGLIAFPPNYSAIVTTKVIEPISRLLTCGRIPEQKRACQFVWNILEHSPSKEIFNDLVVLKQFMGHTDDTRLNMLYQCVLWMLEEGELSPDNHTTLMEGCLAFKKFKSCVQIFDKFGLHDNAHGRLLRAKGMFGLYSNEILRLQKIKHALPVKQYDHRFADCYAMAKNVIRELSRNVLTETDEEASKMLDLAMLGVIYAANELNEVQVCFLCRRNLLDVQHDALVEDVDEVCGNLQETKLSKEKALPTAKRKPKLAHSHFIPNSLLKKLSKGHPLSKDHRHHVELFAKHKISNSLVRSSTQVTFFMLCPDCEGIVAQNGEEQFSTLFFDRIYDVDKPLQSQSGFNISYDKWLYCFCLGLIFRNIHWHRGYFVNEDEIYGLFVKCRERLLDLSLIETSADNPEIYILINPLLASGDDEQAYGYMNMALNNSCGNFMRDITLKDGDRHQMSAHFFLVHIGVINILVKFRVAADVHIPEKFKVNPSGGEYPVPPDEKRKDLLPAGLWKLFQSLAQELEVREREFPTKLNQWFAQREIVYEPSENVKEVFGIMKGGEMDQHSIPKDHITPSPPGYNAKKLHLLPSAFKVRPNFNPSAVVLPKGHRVLLHYTDYKESDKIHCLLFLCVGNNEPYTVESPYIIWYLERPGLICSVGFFISLTGMNATSFLPDKNPKAMLKGARPESLAPFIKRLPELMPQILKLKGFHSIHSLLSRLKNIENMPNIDRKCSKKKFCWYCNYLCSLCVSKPSVFGMTVSGPGDSQFNFCSTDCQAFHPDFVTPGKSMIVLDSSDKLIHSVGPAFPAVKLRCFPIEISHKMLAHVFALDVDKSGFLAYTEIVLCGGDGTQLFPLSSRYVVLYRKTLQYQECLEVFVSEDYSPQTPLPHLSEAADAIMAKLDDIPVQSYINEAMSAINITNVDLQHTPV